MISASVVLFNTSAHDLQRVLTSLADEPVDHIYMVDHSPGDTARANLTIVLSGLPDESRVEYIREDNRGFGAGHNLAMRLALKAGHRHHAVLNPDIYWDSPIFHTLREYMDEHGDTAMVTPRVLNPDGSLQYTCKLIPSPWDLISRRLMPKSWIRRSQARFQLERTGYLREMNVPYMHGCFMYLDLRRAAEIGMFDERFFMYPEDIDLTRRLHERWRTMFLPTVEIFHDHAAASRHSWRMFRIHAGNMIRYFNKWGWISDEKRKAANAAVLASLNL